MIDNIIQKPINHMMPLERIGQFFHDLTGYRPSEATLLSHLDRMSSEMNPIVEQIQSNLSESSVVHADETRLRVNRKSHWLHAISDLNWTPLDIHESRGSKANQAHGFLPKFQNTLVHDCFAMYFKEAYNFDHALCNVHLLRERIGIEVYDKQPRAEVPAS